MYNHNYGSILYKPMYKPMYKQATLYNAAKFTSATLHSMCLDLC